MSLVLYHGDCLDGFTAAWIAKCANPEVSIVPAYFNTPPPELTKRPNVVLVDFSYDIDTMRKIYRDCDELLWLDHHVSALPTMAQLIADILDVLPCDAERRIRDGIPHAAKNLTVWYGGTIRSGAGLAWEWYHGGEYVAGRPMPPLVQYVQDRDLWNDASQNVDAKSIMAYVASWPYELHNWSMIDKTLAGEFGQQMRDAAKIAGEAILRKQEVDIATILKSNVRRMIIGGYPVKVANTPYSLASEVGNRLCKGEPFAATYVDLRGDRKFSLRSDKEDPKSLDVAKIAVKYGGGGHKNASGFHVAHGWAGDDSWIATRGARANPSVGSSRGSV